MTMHVDKRQLRLKALMADTKRRLWGELREELFRTLGEGLHTQYDIPQDIGEQGILDLLEDTGLAVADIHREELSRLDDALRRLEAGKYGICEECGEEIDEARLQVVPYAVCCAECQERRDSPVHIPKAVL
jgi:DnaK suppressor protein